MSPYFIISFLSCSIFIVLLELLVKCLLLLLFLFRFLYLHHFDLIRGDGEKELSFFFLGSLPNFSGFFTTNFLYSTVEPFASKCIARVQWLLSYCIISYVEFYIIRPKTKVESVFLEHISIPSIIT